MRKVIISGITLFCLLLSFFTVRAGLPLFKVPAIKDIKAKYDETTMALGDLKKFQETAYKPAEQNLITSVTNYKATREMYEKIAETKTDEEKEKAFKSQAYDLEYLWIKIGNYAYENKADLTLEIYKTEEQETESLYRQMLVAAQTWNNDKDLEDWIHKELKAYLDICSGSRMMRDYLNYLF